VLFASSFSGLTDLPWRGVGLPRRPFDRCGVHRGLVHKGRESVVKVGGSLGRFVTRLYFRLYNITYSRTHRYIRAHRFTHDIFYGHHYAQDGQGES
jgi:hypothetical protein